MNWTYIGNGRIKDDKGLVWFIYGFEHIEDGRSLELNPLNLDDKGQTHLRVMWALKIFRFKYVPNWTSVNVNYNNREVELAYKTFRQIEYFGPDHPLAGRIKSIIF